MNVVRRPSYQVLLLVLIISIFVCPVQAESRKGKEIVKDGVRRVINPAEGINPPTTVQLEEQ